MFEVIKRYSGKLGEVTITRFTEGKSVEYEIKHKALPTPAHWTNDRCEAIKIAQFLAGRY